LKVTFEAVKNITDFHDLKINLDKTQLILVKKPGKPTPYDFHLILSDRITYTSGKAGPPAKSAPPNRYFGV